MLRKRLRGGSRDSAWRWGGGVKADFPEKVLMQLKLKDGRDGREGHLLQAKVTKRMKAGEFPRGAVVNESN